MDLIRGSADSAVHIERQSDNGFFYVFFGDDRGNLGNSVVHAGDGHRADAAGKQFGRVAERKTDAHVAVIDSKNSHDVLFPFP